MMLIGHWNGCLQADFQINALWLVNFLVKGATKWESIW